MDDLAGKNAFITGGASGIGFAIAKALLNEGMNVAIVDVDRQALDEAAQALDGANAKVVALQLDVTDRDRYAEVATEVQPASTTASLSLAPSGNVNLALTYGVSTPRRRCDRPLRQQHPRPTYCRAIDRPLSSHCTFRPLLLTRRVRKVSTISMRKLRSTVSSACHILSVGHNSICQNTKNGMTNPT